LLGERFKIPLTLVCEYCCCRVTVQEVHSVNVFDHKRLMSGDN